LKPSFTRRKFQEFSSADLNKTTEGNDNTIDTHGAVTAATTQLDIRKTSLRSYKKACQSSSISSGNNPCRFPQHA